MMMRKWFVKWVLMALAGGLLVGNSLARRAEPGTFEVPADIHYEVKTYREGPHPRAGQIGVAVAKKQMANKDAKLPVVIFVHGGGWAKGDKDLIAWRCLQWANKGYVAVTVSYRLVDEAPFPACVYDVKEAIRYVKSLSSELPLDPDNVGLYGYSAGAHLVLLAALMGEDEFHSGTYSEWDHDVKCVYALSAPTDFVDRIKREGPLGFLDEERNQDDAFLARVSPVSYVRADQPPITMAHGSADELVPSYHYLNFQRACERENVADFDLVIDPGGGHMFFFKKSKTYNPTLEAFFAKWLK